MGSEMCIRDSLNADQEIALLDSIDLSSKAVMDLRFNELTDRRAFSATGSIQLDKYHPERMTYTYDTDESQFAVFSDMYYRPGWTAYIDGEEVDYGRVNYVLRGLPVPAGEHQIEFRYAPLSVRLGDIFAIVSGALILLLVAFSILVQKGLVGKWLEKGKD